MSSINNNTGSQGSSSWFSYVNPFPTINYVAGSAAEYVIGQDAFDDLKELAGDIIEGVTETAACIAIEGVTKTAVCIAGDVKDAAVEKVTKIGKNLLVEQGAKLLASYRNAPKVESSGEADSESLIDTVIGYVDTASKQLFLPILERSLEIEAENRKITPEELKKEKALEFAMGLTPQKLFEEDSPLNANPEVKKEFSMSAYSLSASLDGLNDKIDEIEKGLEHGLSVINTPSKACRTRIFNHFKSKLAAIDDRNIADLGVVVNNKILTVVTALTALNKDSTNEDFIKQLGVSNITATEYNTHLNNNIKRNIKRLTLNNPEGPEWNWNIFKVAHRVAAFVFGHIKKAVLTGFLRVYFGINTLPDTILDAFLPNADSEIFKYLKIDDLTEKYNKFSHLIGKIMIDAIFQKLADASTTEKISAQQYADNDAANEALRESFGRVVTSLKDMVEAQKNVAPIAVLASNVAAKLSDMYLPSDENIKMISDKWIMQWSDWIKGANPSILVPITDEMFNAAVPASEAVATE